MKQKINFAKIHFFHVFTIFTCGRRPTGHGAIPVVVVVGVVVVGVVGGGGTFF